MQKSIKEVLEKILLPTTKGWSIRTAEVNGHVSEVTIYVDYLLDYVQIEGSDYPIYDFRSERNWRHLDLWQYKTFIKCRIPRYKDKEGNVKCIQVPWADANERISWLLEKKQ